MKLIVLVCTLVTLLMHTQAQATENIQELFSVNATTTWKDFTLTPFSQQINPKQWVWTNMITLKSKEPINLQELCLEWHGEKITRLQASLYHKKETERTLIPIQENLVCDGLWDPKTQNLKFFLDKKIVAVNKYYLFLHFPEQDTQKIKRGAFIIPEKESMKATTLQ